MPQHSGMGWWGRGPFLGVQGSQLQDFSGFGHASTLSGFVFPAAWLSDALGPTLLYDPAALTFGSMGNPAALQMTGSMTLMTWVWKTTNATIHVLLSKQGNTGARGWNLYTFDNAGGGGYRFVFDIATGVSTTAERHSVVNPTIEQWYHVAGVYHAPAATMDIYVNGMLDNGAVVGTITTSQVSSANVELGRKPASTPQYLAGRLNDTRIYNRALSAGEISAIYNDPRALYRRSHRLFSATPPPATTITAIPPDAILASTNLTGAVATSMKTLIALMRAG